MTTVDFPEMTPITREFAEKLGVAARYDYLEGDLRKVGFGHEAYDLVILGHIFHSEGKRTARNFWQSAMPRCVPAENCSWRNMFRMTTGRGPPCRFCLD